MPIEIRGLAPLLQVFDMPASLAFYRDLLGFQVVESSGAGDDVDRVLLSHSGAQLMLNTAYEKPLRRPPARSRRASPLILRERSHQDSRPIRFPHQKTIAFPCGGAAFVEGPERRDTGRARVVGSKVPREWCSGLWHLFDGAPCLVY
jgi:catechol 2,3-dioxygenase-like lactoylglutathione lyase family enzyme